MGHKPYLALELDEHGSDTGYMTRIEAFFDVLRRPRKGNPARRPFVAPPAEIDGRRLWIPDMHPYTTELAAAALRAGGFDARALPLETEQTFELGRSLTRGSECLPTALTIGSLLTAMRSIAARPEARLLHGVGAGALPVRPVRHAPPADPRSRGVRRRADPVAVELQGLRGSGGADQAADLQGDARGRHPDEGRLQGPALRARGGRNQLRPRAGDGAPRVGVRGRRRSGRGGRRVDSPGCLGARHRRPAQAAGRHRRRDLRAQQRVRQRARRAIDREAGRRGLDGAARRVGALHLVDVEPAPEPGPEVLEAARPWLGEVALAAPLGTQALRGCVAAPRRPARAGHGRGAGVGDDEDARQHRRGGHPQRGPRHRVRETAGGDGGERGAVQLHAGHDHDRDLPAR